ncbi:TetR/AcrR family transcriptional regulator [Arenibacterium sp. LLYu02]|uniref:TetR/AcrR family transcriptional regulator n=1 Tax=Arenibacterium sp. LLYu02 TaxID=3404132 RepID=UPI003B21509D
MSHSDTREKLVRTASKLLRRKGFDGVGLKEILDAAQLPKGSLYYHFPGGKAELAEAATRWAGGWVEDVVSTCFYEARSFAEGAVGLCDTFVHLIETQNCVEACPVLSILQATTVDPALRRVSNEVHAGWTACITRHAERLGEPDPESAAFSLQVKLQGAWVFAFAQQSADPFRRLSSELQTEGPSRDLGNRTS